MSTIAEKSVIVGIDIGSWTFKISVFRNKSFEVLTNQANFRETPSLVSFSHTQRHIGEQATNKIKSNYMNTIRAPLRLIGLQRNYDLVEEQLKYSTVKYDIGEELHFSVQLQQDKKSRIQPQHLLLSLMGKIYKIVLSHGLTPLGYVITVPSYMSHYQRKIVKRCGEIVLHSADIMLIDDWLSIAAEYAYNRITEIKTLDPRIVVIIDIGYSKCSFFVIQFGRKEPKLMDSQHMRFVGSKNMDHLLAEFYDARLKASRNNPESLFSTHKSLVKIIEHIQKQRKVLSANEDCHLNVEALLEDYDLSYNMKREQFQKIIGSVLHQIRINLQQIRQRMPTHIKPHSIELIGGASRIPYVRTIVQQIFKFQASRTMNQSETMARGAAIYGSLSAKLITLDYHISDINLVDICVCWNPTGYKQQFYGENQSQYTKKQVLFKANGRAPDQNTLSFGQEGPLQLYVYYEQAVSNKSIGYLRFNSPNRVRFSLDLNKIVQIKLQFGQFSVCKMQDKKESKWCDLSKWQSDLQASEQRVRKIQQLKNQYEARFYQLRSKINQLKEFMSQEEIFSISNQMTNIQHFIDAENARPLGTPADLELYQFRIQQIQEYSEPLQILEQRRIACGRLKAKYQKLKNALQEVQFQRLDDAQRRKYTLLLRWAIDSYEKMKQSNWQGYYLTDNSLDYALLQLNRILRR